ncbi:MAG: PDZ domain-containing protein [Saprospiraceae bacterium]|nr:PDZ domain-containing protein [Saprospiraceae bacterium]
MSVCIFSLQTLFVHNSILAKEATIRIPFRYVQSFIIIDVQIENVIPLQLIFDTGAEHTILFEKYWTDIISNAYQRDIKVIGSDLQTEIPAKLTHPLSLNFPLRYKCLTQLIVLEDHSTNISQVIGEPVHGILSASLFSQFIIQIDYKKRNIILHPLSTKVPEGFTELDIQIYKNKPYLETEVATKWGQKQKLNLLLDTGASLSLLMYTDSTSNIDLPDKMIPGYLGSGLGGMLKGFVGKVGLIYLDTFTLSNVISHFLMVDTEYSRIEKQNKQGLIGNLMLEKFELYIDYHRKKLFLKPTKKLYKEIKFDKSGMLIISGGNHLQNYYVSQVIPNSPAYEAGILPKDELVSINGWPCSWLSLSKILSSFQKEEGKKINLKLRRNGKKIKISFNLKSLI